jgi:hypothetical protein
MDASESVRTGRKPGLLLGIAAVLAIGYAGFTANRAVEATRLRPIIERTAQQTVTLARVHSPFDCFSESCTYQIAADGNRTEWYAGDSFVGALMRKPNQPAVAEIVGSMHTLRKLVGINDRHEVLWDALPGESITHHDRRYRDGSRPYFRFDGQRLENLGTYAADVYDIPINHPRGSFFIVEHDRVRNGIMTERHGVLVAVNNACALAENCATRRVKYDVSSGALRFE